MIEYLKYFFNPGHLFNLRPPAMQPRAIIILAIVFGIFVILAVVSKLVAAKTKDSLKVKAWRRLWYLFLTMGIIGFVYLFFAWQGVTLLASRLLLLIWLLVVIVWLSFIVKYLFLEVPKLRQDIEQKRKFEKYIP